MKCFRCGKETIPSTTTDVTDVDNCLVVIRHVPCEECPNCGEVYYNGVITKKLEQINEMAASVANEITIVDYRKNVA